MNKQDFSKSSLHQAMLNRHGDEDVSGKLDAGLKLKDVLLAGEKPNWLSNYEVIIKDDALLLMAPDKRSFGIDVNGKQVIADNSMARKEFKYWYVKFSSYNNNTYKIKDDLKAKGYRWDGSCWKKVFKREDGFEAVIEELKEATKIGNPDVDFIYSTGMHDRD
jgi:hypothetical protein